MNHIRTMLLGLLLIMGSGVSFHSASQGDGKREWKVDVLRETFGFDHSTLSDDHWQDIRQACRKEAA